MHKGVTWNDCNFNLIVRYFGRAYDYECKGGRSLKRLRVALRCHTDELARFASPGLRIPVKSKRIVENRAEYSGAPKDLNLLTVYHNLVGQLIPY